MLLTSLPAPTSHAALASAFAVAAYVTLHAGIGAVLAGYGLWRWHGGYISMQRRLDLRIGSLWHDYTAVTGLVGLAFPFVLQSLTGSGGR